MGMSQSEWIGGAIIAGFLIFLAMKGKLATYWRLLTGGGTGKAASSGAGASTGSTIGGIVGGLVGPGLGGVGAAIGGGGDVGGAIGGAVQGTITGDGQTSSTTFPMIPGGMLSLPGVKF